jgi:hypothetical protein
MHSTKVHIPDVRGSQQYGVNQIIDRELEPAGALSMKAIKNYPTTVEADLARIALDSAGIPSLVVGVAASMEGGLIGVQLLVPDEQVEA